MSRTQINKRTRAQNERPIVRNANSFSRGTYNDPPSSEVIEGGIYYSNNMHNTGRTLQTRPGTREWGNYQEATPSERLPDRVTGLSMSWVIADGNRRWTLDNPIDYTFSPSDIGDFLTFTYDGIEYSENIVDVDDGDPAICITLPTTSIPVSGTLTVGIGEKVNLLFYSESNDKVIVQLGTRILVSNDNTITELNECYFVGNSTQTSSNTELADSISQASELNGTVYIFNAKGLYRVSLSEQPFFYFKCNVGAPTVPINNDFAKTSDIAFPDSPALVYGRRRVYSYGLLSGSGARDRTTEDVKILWESGGVIPLEDKRDYGVQWTVEQPSIENELTFGQMFISEEVPIASHIFVYGTKNVHIEEGQEKFGNNPEEYIWELSIPTHANLLLDIQYDSGTTFNFTVLVGVLSKELRGNRITFSPKAGTGEQPQETISGVISTIDADGTSGTLTYLGDPADLEVVSSNDLRAATLGGTVPFEANINEGVLTITAIYLPDGWYKDYGYVGQVIWLTTGYYAIITEVISDGVYRIVSNTSTSGSNTVVCSMGTDIGPLVATSDINDTELSFRASTLPMISRFMTGIPNGALGVIVPAFYLTAQRNGTTVSYGQISEGYDYLIGTYNPTYQFTEIEDDTIQQLRVFDTKVAIRCRNSTKSMTTSNYSTWGYPEVGRFVYVISNIIEVSSSIGSDGIGSSSYITGTETEWVLTNEPALRPFNGNSYGEDYLDGKFMNKTREMQNAFTTAYHPEWGFIIWGRK